MVPTLQTKPVRAWCLETFLYSERPGLITSTLNYYALAFMSPLKVAESGVKLVPKAEIPNPVESAREAKKKTKTKQKPTKVWEPPPWAWFSRENFCQFLRFFLQLRFEF